MTQPDDSGLRPAVGLQADPEVAAALGAVLKAGRPARFKRLTIACPNDHTLARVYQTAVGLVVVHDTGGVKKARTADMPGFGPVQMPPVRGPRAETGAYLLDEHDSGSYHLFPMQCRCTTANVRARELWEAMAAGKRRLLVSS